jgi:calcium-dependent protein kinase
MENGVIPRETVGTSYYIAPEVIQSDYDEKCDMWSIGVILHILLSGRPPFDGKNDREIIRNILSFNFDIQIPEMRNVSYKAIDVVQQLITQDSTRRYSAYEVLEHDWVYY